MTIRQTELKKASIDELMSIFSSYKNGALFKEGYILDVQKELLVWALHKGKKIIAKTEKAILFSKNSKNTRGLEFTLDAVLECISREEETYENRSLIIS